jgi:hypothetical protein
LSMAVRVLVQMLGYLSAEMALSKWCLIGLIDVGECNHHDCRLLEQEVLVFEDGNQT